METIPDNVISIDKTLSKYRPLMQNILPEINNVTEMSKLDSFLEEEKLSNKNESWNKLDKGTKIQKLHIYAETYVKENKLPAKEIRTLKTFFSECINKNKLQKAKEVVYDKSSGTITNIPFLVFHSSSRNFSLKNLDNKRMSTLKSLTPKRVSQNVYSETEYAVTHRPDTPAP